MAGAGRKGAYRKSVLEDVLNNYPVPDLAKGETLARVVAPRGGNLMEVLCADGANGLAILPTKFRKLIWVKRGDVVIVSGATDDIETREGKEAAVKYMVIHVLYKDQILHVKKEGHWPSSFDAGGGAAAAAAAEAAEEEVREQEAQTTAGAVAQLRLDGEADADADAEGGVDGPRTFFDGRGTDTSAAAAEDADASAGASAGAAMNGAAAGGAAEDAAVAPQGLDRFGNGVAIPDEDEDGSEEEEEEDAMDDIFVNNNRQQMVRGEESSDEESDEE